MCYDPSVVFSHGANVATNQGCLNVPGYASLRRGLRCAQVLGAGDRLLVKAYGADLPIRHLKTILHICTACRVPLVVNEPADVQGFAKELKVRCTVSNVPGRSVLASQCAQSRLGSLQVSAPLVLPCLLCLRLNRTTCVVMCTTQGYVEDTHFARSEKPPLTMLMMGSEQAPIYNVAMIAVCGLTHFGIAPIQQLPMPSLSLIVTLLEAGHAHMEVRAYVSG
jgi:hypothetical protein